MKIESRNQKTSGASLPVLDPLVRGRLLDARMDEMTAHETIVADLRSLNLGARATKRFCEVELGYSDFSTRSLMIELGLIVTTDSLVSSDPVVNMRIEKLKAWRRDRARREDVPAYRVLSNRTLMAAAASQALDASDLAQIPGFGVKKVAVYGSELLRLFQI